MWKPQELPMLLWWLLIYLYSEGARNPTLLIQAAIRQPLNSQTQNLMTTPVEPETNPFRNLQGT